MAYSRNLFFGNPRQASRMFIQRRMIPKKEEHVCYHFQRIIDFVGDNRGQFSQDSILLRISKGDLSLAKRFLGFLPLSDFSFQRLSLLLQLANVAQPVGLAFQRRIAFTGNYCGMFAANLDKWLAVFLQVKPTHRICTAKRKRMCLRQIVPELLQTDSRRVLSVGPKQRDHFSEGRNTWLDDQRSAGLSRTLCRA